MGSIPYSDLTPPTYIYILTQQVPHLLGRLGGPLYFILSYFLVKFRNCIELTSTFKDIICSTTKKKKNFKNIVTSIASKAMCIPHNTILESTDSLFRVLYMCHICVVSMSYQCCTSLFMLYFLKKLLMSPCHTHTSTHSCVCDHT